MPTPLRQVVVAFAGDSGDGMQLTGNRFSVDSAQKGYDIVTLPTFPAEIRAPQGSLGGVSSFQVQFADRNVTTPGEELDALVAMNPAALKVELPMLRKGGVLITDESEFTTRNLKKAGYDANPLEDHSLDSYQVIAFDLTGATTRAVEGFGLNRKAVSLTRNMFALGLIHWVYTGDMAPTLAWLGEKFASKPDVRDANIAALKAGWDFGDTTELIADRYEVEPAEVSSGVYRQISGNHALTLGLLAASHLSGMRLFLGAYPITPASDILAAVARYAHLGALTFQAEDEIAAAGAALGASFGGSLGVTATSGPGFTLKQEVINLAVMAELPLVVVDVQRAGPSTGIPTRTEQSDLLQALNGRNGDSPVPVIAPTSPSDCFDAAIWACRVAIEHRTPVVLLSDAYLANGSEPWRVPDVADLTPINPDFTTEAEDYSPYTRDDQLRRSWAIPGTSGLEHRLGGLEKDYESGEVSYDGSNHEKMSHTRAGRIAAISLDGAWVDDPASARVAVVGWGSSWGAIQAACATVREAGHAVAHVHVRTVNPLPPDLGDVLRSYDHVIVAEVNMGQFAGIVRARYLVDAQPWTQVRGRPLSSVDLAGNLIDVIQGGSDE